MKKMGTWWRNKNIDLVEVEGKIYALYGWNGEKYYNCWIVSGENHTEASKEKYVLTPIYKEIGDEEYEIYDYIVIN